MDDLARWKDNPIWDSEACKNAYAYPINLAPRTAEPEGLRLAEGIPEDELYRTGPYVCARSPESHSGPFKHAIDFLVPDGSPVFAALDGEVIEIHESSNRWGPTEDFRDDLNFMTIAHGGEEYSQYCYLARESVIDAGIVLGRRVRKGDRIATVGKSGWTDRDHLHFIVFRNHRNESPWQFKSLAVRFE